MTFHCYKTSRIPHRGDGNHQNQGRAAFCAHVTKPQRHSYNLKRPVIFKLAAIPLKAFERRVVQVPTSPSIPPSTALQSLASNVAVPPKLPTLRLDEASLESALLRSVLNQVDYGLAAMTTDTRQLLFANGPAANALHAQSPQRTGLVLHEGRVCTRMQADMPVLEQALQRTKTGQRALLQLHDAGRSAGADNADLPSPTLVAVMPLNHPGFALLAFTKQQLCDATTVTLFARESGLTMAEGRVLAQVCKGLRPTQIAVHQGVQISTVRSQLRSIRQKTACESVRDLVQRVSVLPPLALNLPHYLSSRMAVEFS